MSRLCWRIAGEEETPGAEPTAAAGDAQGGSAGGALCFRHGVLVLTAEGGGR